MQVTGHAKTVLVLVGSWLYLHERMTSKQLIGMSFAVAGMVAYGYFAAKKRDRKDVAPSVSPAKLSGLQSVLQHAANGKADHSVIMRVPSRSGGLG